jgi:hypothetical protein
MSGMKSARTRWWWIGLLLWLFVVWTGRGADFASLCADRAVVERVYFNHRLGEKPDFEKALPRAALENLVRQDMRKEAALKQAYGVAITQLLLDAEVRRINTTTRAPEMLQEIKSALGNDPDRFAAAIARPMLVDRLLRENFDNDNNLHAPQRRRVEQKRNELLDAKAKGAGFTNLPALLRAGCSNEVTETTWQLSTRPGDAGLSAPEQAEIKKKFGPDAQIISPPATGGKDAGFYFDDLPGELQNVLRVQLQKPGDISAVIETPSGFLLFVAKEKTAATLSVAGLSLPKRSFDEWLSEQTKVK